MGTTSRGRVPRRINPSMVSDRKSTRLNSSHTVISYAVFCLKKKLVELVGTSASDKVKNTRDYLSVAFTDINDWERGGADASSAGMVDAGFENQKELTKMQLYIQKEIAEMQKETQKKIAHLQSATTHYSSNNNLYTHTSVVHSQGCECDAAIIYI